MPLRSRLSAEPLEERAVPAAFVVDLTDDVDDGDYTAGHVSLREAVNLSNADATIDDDVITFSPALSKQTITLGATELALTDTTGKLTINGPVVRVSVSGNNAVRVLRVAAGVTAELVNVVVTAGRAPPAGGGGGVANDGTLTLTDCEVVGCTAPASTLDGGTGGGLLNTGTMTLTRCRVADNTAAFAPTRVPRSDGGGAFNSGTLTVTNSVFSGNVAFDGGGIVNASAGTLVVSASTFTGNVANDEGGAVRTSGKLTLTASTVSGNTARFGGGVFSSGPSALVACTLSDNRATGSGLSIGDHGGSGGGFRASEEFTLVNCTLTRNTADQWAGGVATGTFTAVNVTVTGNTATPLTPGFFNGSRFSLGGGLGTPITARLVNSLVAGNSSRSAPDGPLVPDDLRGGADSASSFNLIGAGIDLTGLADGANGNRIGTAAAPIDGKLGPLANNGGPTLTHALLAGSPAINAGSDAGAAGLTTDQRGLPRFAGRVDIGAFEEQNPPSSPPPSPPPVAPRVTAVGAATGAAVRLLNSDGTDIGTVTAFDGPVPGGTRVAVGDFNGDTFPDLAAGTGPGDGRVRVLDGVTGAELFATRPFEESFTGGVIVAAGDLTGDGKADLVVTADTGGGGRVRVFRGGDFVQLADFLGIDDPNFRGGARAAVGDLDGNGVADLLVAAGAGGGPRVALYDGASLLGERRKLTGDFFVFEPSVRDGVYVAAGDLDGDGAAEGVFGGGPGAGPRILALSGRELAIGRLVEVGNFFSGDPADRTGAQVAVKDLGGDARADLVVAAGGRVVTYIAVAPPIGGWAHDLVGVFVG